MMAALIDHLWQSTLVAAGAALLVLLLRGNGAHVRYWVWFAASVKFLVPFAALVTLGAALGWRSAQAPVSSTEWTELMERVAQPMSTLTSSSDGLAPAVAEPLVLDGGVDPAAAAIGAWLLGVAVVLGVWGVRWLRLRRLVLGAKALSIPGMIGRIDVRATSSSIEPGIFGIVKPVLLVPAGVVERLTGPQLQAVIAHEMCHVRRRDNLTAAVHMLVEALFWFHPLVWWIGARLLEERERACDEAVVAAGIEPNAYAEGILEVCRQCIESPLPCAAGVGAGRALKARVERIVDRCAVRPLSTARRAVLAIALAVVLGLPIVIGAVHAPALSAQAAFDEAMFAEVSIEEGYDTGRDARLLIAPPGTLTTRNLPLRQLIVFAYGLQEAQVVGPPDLDATRYTIRARAPTPPLSYTSGGELQEELRRMTRGLLARRFDLRFEWERRRLPALALVAVTEPRLPAGDRQESGPSIQLDARSVTVRNGEIDLLVDWLSSQLGVPVVDQTGLTETYSFTLAWGADSESTGEGSVRSKPDRETLAHALETSFGLSLAASEEPVDRMVVTAVGQPEGVRPAETPVAVDPELLESYVGYYGILEIGWVVRVERAGDHLVVQENARAPMEVYPRSETEFFATTVDAEIEFDEANGMRMLLLRGGDRPQPIWGPSIDPAVGQARLDELRARVDAQTPTPGTEGVARRIVRVLGGQEALPAEDRGFDPARAVRDGLLRDLPDAFAQRGELVSVSFESVNPEGNDVYEIGFENLMIELMIGMRDESNVATLNYRVTRLPGPRAD